MRRFKAIETDPRTRQRTGRSFELAAASRDEAITQLTAALGVAAELAHPDPARTLVEIGGLRWTLVALAEQEQQVAPSLRRAGAKHKHVRD